MSFFYSCHHKITIYLGISRFLDIGTQRLEKLQGEYDFQKNTLLETWDHDEMDITDGQDRAEFKLLLVTYIQDRDFKADKKGKELQRATLKNDARLEVSYLTY